MHGAAGVTPALTDADPEGAAADLAVIAPNSAAASTALRTSRTRGMTDYECFRPTLTLKLRRT
jgi:hypothetical protein